MTSPIRSLAVLAAAALMAVACGQKPGVNIAAGTDTGSASDPIAEGPAGPDVFTLGGGDADTDSGSSGEGFTDSATSQPDSTGGTSTGSSTSTGAGSGSSGSTGSGSNNQGSSSSGGGSTSGGSSTGTGSSQPGSSQPTAQPTQSQPQPTQSSAPSSQRREAVGSDSTGVTDSTISIAVHAPITGAAPLPSTSFEKSRGLYWDYVLGKGDKIVGRTNVDVAFRDDKYDPASAQQVCRELAASNFFVVGGGGTDQIQTCGRFAQVAQFPYFSAGVTESGLEGNPWYFAASMSYKDQARLLARYAAKNYPGKKVAAVITDTPNFDDAASGWEAGLRDAGLTGNSVPVRRHPRNDTSWYSSYVQDLSSKNVDVVFILSSPLDYIRFAQKGQENGWNPQWVGVGISMGLNAVLTNGCPAVDNGVFFSPFPGLDYAQQNIPDFFAAARQYGTPSDDISLALWGIAAQQHVMFDAYENLFGNEKLTREGFRAVVETLTIETGIFPRTSYSANNHFGGTGVHVLQADCGSGQYKTVATFASNF